MFEDRSLSALVGDLRRAWRIVVAAALVGAAAGLLATATQVPRYRAEGSVVVSPARFLDPVGTDALPALSDTIVELASSEAVLAPTASGYVLAASPGSDRARRAREATPAWVDQSTRAVRVGESSVLELSATGATARDALDLSRAFVSALTKFVQARASEGQTADAPPAGVGLVVLSAGELLGKVSPTPVRNVLIGLNAGVLLGIVLALTFGRRRGRAPGDAAAELGVPSLGAVRPGRREPGGGVLATLKLLESLSRPTGPVRVLLTGTVPADRIAEVAVTLVRSCEDFGQPALLVDADLESRALSRRLRAPDRAGPWSLAGGEASVEDMSHEVVLAPALDHDGAPSVHLLPAGTTPAAGVVLDAVMVRSLFEAIESRFDVVVVSGPPLGPDRNLPVLVSTCDCWVLVADDGVPGPAIRDARALMLAVATPMIGMLDADGAPERVRAGASSA